MRTFLLRSLTFFAFAIVTSILVFFWLHNPTVLPAASEQVKSLVTGEPQASNSEENAAVRKRALWIKGEIVEWCLD